MAPEKIFWPKTLEEFNRLSKAAKETYKPLVDNLQPHQLDALAACAREALDSLRKAAHEEDIRRGYRPPVGNRGQG